MPGPKRQAFLRALEHRCPDLLTDLDAIAERTRRNAEEFERREAEAAKEESRP